ncbi:hypothetical protein C7M51_02586 [Mixta intestinalis]|uniref:Uncharacterized protein n=1 Tax=Mixta intestinalis TaxID=1615494 RepID=A0A6P1Q369_9GAMM|nr:hypothetical protein C7M51_02586 [Mixta intestinalis]
MLCVMHSHKQWFTACKEYETIRLSEFQFEVVP